MKGELPDRKRKEIRSSTQKEKKQGMKKNLEASLPKSEDSWGVELKKIVYYEKN